MGLKTVVLNSERMNYDGKLDLSVLSSQVKEYASTEPDQILERVQGMDVVVTKEMPVFIWITSPGRVLKLRKAPTSPRP